MDKGQTKTPDPVGPGVIPRWLVYFTEVADRGRRKRLNDFAVELNSSKKSVKSSNELVLVLKYERLPINPVILGM